MSNPWARKDDFEEEEAAFGGDMTMSSKEATVFLIDARQAMAGKNSAGEVYFRNACQAAVHFMKTQIISSAKDMTAVWFYGTKKMKNENSFPGVYELVELSPSSAANIKLVESLARQPDEDEGAYEGAFDFATEIGHLDDEEPVPLHHALWAISMSFAGRGVKEGDLQQIWLFTNNDSPNPDDPGFRNQAKQKAEDLLEMGQTLQLYYMSTPEHTFNPRAFFSSIIAMDDDGAETMIDCSNLLSIMETVRMKKYRKRAYARLPWKLAEGIELSVAVYNLIYEAKKPSAVQLETATNQRVKVETSWTCAQIGRALLPHEIKTYHKFGAESKVFFSKDDMKEIKNFGEPGIRLMGFKPKEHLTPHLNLRSPYFIYPHEEGITGSTTAFRALQEKMIEKDKVAIVRLVMRVGSEPRFAALVAKREELDDDGAVESPPGMFMIPLPYADDLRQIKADPTVEANPDQIAAAKRMVQAVDAAAFNSNNFDNPVLGKHYASVQALALNEEDADWNPEEDDVVKPDVEGLTKYEGVFAEFRESFGGDAEARVAGKKRRAPSASTGAKRGRGGAAKPPAAKKKRGGGKEEEADDAPVADVEGLARAGKLKKLKVAELKAFLTSKGMKTSGRKADLVERIEEFYGV